MAPGNCLVPSGNKPLPDAILTHIYVAIWLHQAAVSQMVFHRGWSLKIIDGRRNLVKNYFIDNRVPNVYAIFGFMKYRHTWIDWRALWIQILRFHKMLLGYHFRYLSVTKSIFLMLWIVSNKTSTDLQVQSFHEFWIFSCKKRRVMKICVTTNGNIAVLTKCVSLGASEVAIVITSVAVSEGITWTTKLRNTIIWRPNYLCIREHPFPCH